MDIWLGIITVLTLLTARYYFKLNKTVKQIEQENTIIKEWNNNQPTYYELNEILNNTKIKFEDE